MYKIVRVCPTKHLPARLGGLILFLSMTVVASADTLNFDPANTWSGTAPGGSLTAAFTDIAAGVQLVIDSNLGPGENLDPNKTLYLNISNSSLLSTLAFTLTANTGFSEAATVLTGEDAFRPDGDGYMDILFTYGSATKAFTNGESQTYLITGGAGLVASDFTTAWSYCPGGCNGPHLAAVHVQNTPNGGGGSAWVGGTVDTSVPEPSSTGLLFSALALIGVGGCRWAGTKLAQARLP
jgi:hypothetical protein